MSLKTLNKIDSLYDQLFQAQIEHRWKDADLISKELQRLERIEDASEKRSFEREEGEGALEQDPTYLRYIERTVR